MLPCHSPIDSHLPNTMVRHSEKHANAPKPLVSMNDYSQMAVQNNQPIQANVTNVQQNTEVLNHQPRSIFNTTNNSTYSPTNINSHLSFKAPRKTINYTDNRHIENNRIYNTYYIIADMPNKKHHNRASQCPPLEYTTMPSAPQSFYTGSVGGADAGQYTQLASYSAGGYGPGGASADYSILANSNTLNDGPWQQPYTDFPPFGSSSQSEFNPNYNPYTGSIGNGSQQPYTDFPPFGSSSQSEFNPNYMGNEPPIDIESIRMMIASMLPSLYQLTN